MIYEFEGKNEKDAIDKAIAELNLQVDQFDVEILDIQKGGFFKKGSVKIRVHVDNDEVDRDLNEDDETQITNKNQTSQDVDQDLSESTVEKISEFLHGIVTRMGYSSEISFNKNAHGKLVFRFSGKQAARIIGRRGKTLDALQMFANIYLAKLGYPQVRAVVDCENYRRNKEESIIRMAYDVADKVSTTKHSVLLHPMNPYERRLVHTTLQDLNYIETKSEGNGLYKQVRIIYKR
ncbi:MAG: protein jag [Treponemataceae bacterium]